MRTAKVCIVGDFAVGKTSTIARSVHNEFSEKYLTTVGIKIDTKLVTPRDAAAPLKLVIWDIAGAERFGELEYGYLRGAAGYLLVADGTRAHTLDAALAIERGIAERHGELPHVLLLNKRDRDDLWELAEERVSEIEDRGRAVFYTSAKTGENVERAIAALVETMAAAAAPAAPAQRTPQ